MKTCSKCHQTKPLDEFYINKMMSDGHFSKCKSCTKQDTNNRRKDKIKNDPEWAAKESERHRKNSRKRTLDGTAALSMSEYRRKNTLKVWARSKLLHAIKSGKVVKQPCQVCGSTENVHGHHHNYFLPLEVEWLCSKHHGEKHLISDI